MRIYAYLRASTKEQDANRAKNELIEFCQSKNLQIQAFFIENESGATLERPELFRLLEIAAKNDILLLEQVDRISRLKEEDWNTLKNSISTKGIRIVSLDLPTSHSFMTEGDEFTRRILAAVNSMLLDTLAAVARKDYVDRRRRQKQGVQQAKKAGKYKGRQIDQKLHENIVALLKDKKTYSEIQFILGCSRVTIAKVKKLYKAEIEGD